MAVLSVNIQFTQSLCYGLYIFLSPSCVFSEVHQYFFCRDFTLSQSFTVIFSIWPLQGFKYLYLTPQDYKKVSALNSVHCEHVEDEGESRCFSLSFFLYFLNHLWGNESTWVTHDSEEWPCSIPPGTRSQTSSEKMKGWAWRIWKALAWSLESRPWPTRRSSPWTWWGSSGCAHTLIAQGELRDARSGESIKSRGHSRHLTHTWWSGPAGHMQGHRDRSLSGEARPENHSSGQLAHYSHRSWSTQQGNVMQVVR